MATGQTLGPQVLIGPGMGATPLLYATALAALDNDGVVLQVLMVRDKRKEHNQKNIPMEGLAELKITREPLLSFAQILGIADNSYGS